uniref:Uncharacterized protein n=1 Tax=Anguilla anguilla TaxID=7936 RepID=A0A0E9UF53_ANGAN
MLLKTMRGWCCCMLPQHTWPEPAANIACFGGLASLYTSWG